MTHTLDSNMLHMENCTIQNHNILLSAAYQLQVYYIYSELILIFYFKASHITDSFIQP